MIGWHVLTRVRHNSTIMHSSKSIKPDSLLVTLRWLIPVALCLTTFALRLVDLVNRGYWLDESFTLLRILGSWTDLVSNTVIRQDTYTTDLLPALYFALLKIWMLAAGESSFVLRLFSVFTAVLAIPTTYVLGCRVFGRTPGIIAALFACICAAYQWYGWELRMYTMMVPLAVAQMYLIALLLKKFSFRIALYWLALAVASIVTHYSFVSLLLAQVFVISVAYGPQLLTTRRAGFTLRSVVILTSTVLVALAFLLLPPVFNTIQQMLDVLLVTRFKVLYPPVSPIAMVYDVFNSTVFGQNATDPTSFWILLAFSILALFGLTRRGSSKPDSSNRMLLIACMIVPILFWTLVSIAIPNRPSYRYLIFVTPILHACFANGIMRIYRFRIDFAGAASKVLTAVLLAFCLITQSFGLVQSFSHGASWQDDWRSMAQHIRKNWAANDALIIDINTPEAILQQLLGDMPMDTIFAHSLINLQNNERWSPQLSNKYDRVWFVNTGGDNGEENPQIHSGLARYPRLERVDFGGRTTRLQLELYGLEKVASQELPPGAAAVTGSLIRGYAWSPGSPYYSDSISTLSLWLRWQPRTLAHAVNLDLRLLDGQSGLWMSWFVNDAMARIAPRQECTVEVFCRLDLPLPMPAGLPPISYTFAVRLLDEVTGSQIEAVRMPLSPESVRCCIRVDASNSKATRVNFGQVSLTGLEVQSIARPGQTVPINLIWRANTRLPSSWDVQISLLTPFGNSVATINKPMGIDLSEPFEWPIGEIIRDHVAIKVPAGLRPGTYNLSTRIVWQEQIQSAPILVGSLTVLDYDRHAPIEPVTNPSRAQVANLTFLGYDVVGELVRNTRMTFRSSWVVDKPIQIEGVLFMHVIGPTGDVISQDDLKPEMGARELDTFRVGEGFVIAHRIVLPEDAPSGRYQVIVGAYDSRTGSRFSASQHGVHLRDDLVIAGAFDLK